MLKTCIAIFFARICDVSIGSVKTVFMVKGKSFLSSILAFFELLIWYAVAKKALNTEINSIFVPIAYAAGYATGTLIGTYISKTFIKGEVCLMVIIKNNKALIDNIRKMGYAVSVCRLQNDMDNIKKSLLLIQINKNSLSKIKNYILKHEKNAFIIINESNYSHNGLVN